MYAIRSYYGLGQEIGLGLLDRRTGKVRIGIEGRRGSLSGDLRVMGIQGHVAFV